MMNDEQRAVEWARRFLADPGAIILDTETTGLGRDAQIVEISIVNVAGETLLDTLVRPTVSIPPEATAIHGISDADVANAPAWPEVAGRMFALLRQASRIAIYNAAYDKRLVFQTCVAHDLADWPEDIRGVWVGLPDELSEKITCAMHWYAAWYGDWSEYRQSYRWQKLDGGHRALGDCLATLECIKRMAEE